MELLRTLEEKVSPAHAVVLTVDVQNDFFHEDGYVGKTGSPRGRYLEMRPD